MFLSFIDIASGAFMHNLSLFLSLSLLLSIGTVSTAQILPPGATVTQIATGYNFTEGPLHDGAGGILFTNLISNNPNASDIIRYDISAGTSQTLVTDSGGANGMYRDANGKVITADGGMKRVSRRSLSNLNLVESVLASSFNGIAFNGPNDLVLDATGGIYFTDPNYAGNNQAESVYYIDGQGALTRILTGFNANAHPNGIMLSLDEQTLYLALQQDAKIMAYDVTSPGIVSNARTFANLGGQGPDGMTRDRVGNIYAAWQNAVWVYNPAGTKISTIPVPGRPTNVEFGPDETTLFITSGSSLYKIGLNIPELPSADFDGDGDIDGKDFLAWQRGFGTGATKSTGDANNDGIVNAADLVIWQNQFDTAPLREILAVPEPGSISMALGWFFLVASRNARRKRPS